MKAFFISIPHSGERIPPETLWLHGLPEAVVMCDVDRYVDRLYRPATEPLKIACVTTQWHRYVVDLNRMPEDIDAESVIGSGKASGKFMTGIHWIKTTRGDRLMLEPMSPRLHRQLVERYFLPFHQDVIDMYGYFRERGAKKIFHLDAHSMPSRGMASHPDPGETRAEIVVSDGEGKSCEPFFKDVVIEAYREAGLQVAYNWPYKGGQVTQTYGKPKEGQNTIQVEINRALYMDEENKQWIAERGAVLSAQLVNAVRLIHERLPEI